MKKILSLVILVSLFSCKNSEKENKLESIKKELTKTEEKLNNKHKLVQLYYPNKLNFLHYEKSGNKLYLSNYKSFDDFLIKLENIKKKKEKATLTIRENNFEYNFVITTGKREFKSPYFRYKNKISISSNSIYKFEYHSIDSLGLILKKDFLNNGKHHHYSETPEKLIISITDSINNIENLLLKISTEFNDLQLKSNESLKLKIYFNKSFDTLPARPPIPPPVNPGFTIDNK